MKHPVKYPDVPSLHNGRKGKSVEILDCGCGYGGLLGNLMKRTWG